MRVWILARSRSNLRACHSSLRHLPNIVPGATTYQFTVTYADPNGTNNGIDVSTLIDNNNAVRVTGPFGFDVPATFVSIDDPTDGTPRTVTYSIHAAGRFVEQSGRRHLLSANAGQPGRRHRWQLRPCTSTWNDSCPDPAIRRHAMPMTPAMAVCARPSSWPTQTPTTMSSSSIRASSTRTRHRPADCSASISATGGGLTITGPAQTTSQSMPAAIFGSSILTAPTLNLSGMTVTGGLPTDEWIWRRLRASGTVTLDHMVFTANNSGAAGGAIGMAGATRSSPSAIPQSPATQRSSTAAGSYQIRRLVSPGEQHDLRKLHLVYGRVLRPLWRRRSLFRRPRQSRTRPGWLLSGHTDRAQQHHRQ